MTTIPENRFNRRLAFLAVAGGFLVITATTNAAIALVDLSTAASVANPAGDGKYWNSVGSGTNNTSSANLIDSTGAPTGYETVFGLAITTISVSSGGVSGAGFGGTGVNGPVGPDPFDEANAITDGLFANNDNNGTAVFAFTGLVGGETYDFSAIGGRNSGGEDGEIIILDDATPFGSGSSGANTTYALLNDGTVLDFSVDATLDGEIWFEFRSGSGNNGTGATINAFSIDGPINIPEPSTIVFSGLALLGLGLRRRRNAK